VLGLVFDSHVLPFERTLQGVVKELAQIRHRDDARSSVTFVHICRPSRTLDRLSRLKVQPMRRFVP
jgi:hypothetical protein